MAEGRNFEDSLLIVAMAKGWLIGDKREIDISRKELRHLLRSNRYPDGECDVFMRRGMNDYFVLKESQDKTFFIVDRNEIPPILRLGYSDEDIGFYSRFSSLDEARKYVADTIEKRQKIYAPMRRISDTLESLRNLDDTKDFKKTVQDELSKLKSVLPDNDRLTVAFLQYEAQVNKIIEIISKDLCIAPLGMNEDWSLYHYYYKRLNNILKLEIFTEYLPEEGMI